jgi:hypothetical protein
MNQADDFLKKNQMYSMQDYQGIPEFDIAEKDNYNARQGEKLPFLRFSSNKPDEVALPIHEDYSLRYSDVHYEIERWTLFNHLPTLAMYDKKVAEEFVAIQQGVKKLPNYI